MPGPEDQLAAGLHVVGFVMAAFMGARLLGKTRRAGMVPDRRRSVVVFVLAWLTLYAASIAFHLSPPGPPRALLMALDQSAIFVLIAAGWTPLGPFRLPLTAARTLGRIVWGLAAAGIAVELLAAQSGASGMLTQIGLLLYIVQGVAPFALFWRVLMRGLSAASLGFLFGGMAVYSIGFVFYWRTDIPWHHAVWHWFILLGCLVNFAGVRQLIREDSVAANALMGRSMAN